MPNKTYGSLDDYEGDDLLRELRERASGPKGGKPSGRKTGGIPVAGDGLLAGATDEAIYKNLEGRAKVIYGVDDRVDVPGITDPAVLRITRSVACLIDVGKLQDNGDGTTTILSRRFRDAYSLCSEERFGVQPTAASCTGFLVEPTVMATAGHCIDGTSIPRIRFLFGFAMRSDKSPRLVISNEDIYQGVGLIARQADPGGSDYALVRLERPVRGRAPLKLRRSGKIKKTEAVYVIGHPAGLPLKYARGSHVRSNDKAAFFVANLDTYGGNSGSPVFNEVTDEVEGILVRGETDFVRVGDCWRSNFCPDTGCRGEDVTRASEFVPFVEVTKAGDAPYVAEDLDLRVDRLEDSVAGIKAILEDIRGSISG